jgi:hypothetical protein
MTNETLALLSLISLLLGFLLIGWLDDPKRVFGVRHPKPPKAKHEEAIAKALAFLDTSTAGTGSIYLRCAECGGRKYQPSDTAIETTVAGLVCVAVCRSCGAALVSRILKPSEAAEYVDAGSARVWPRLVVARAELNGVHNATQFSDAVIEARRLTP